jgi:hypothetical protein
MVSCCMYSGFPACCWLPYTVAFSLLLAFLLLRAIMLSSLLLLVASVASVACFNVVACVPVIAVISAVVGSLEGPDVIVLLLEKPLGHG